MSERGQVRAGLGVPSMVLVLVVLCLSMLGVLSLISARNDAALAQRHTVLTAAYDEAAAAAQRALCDLWKRPAHTLVTFCVQLND